MPSSSALSSRARPIGHPGLQHRPSRLSMLSEMSSEGAMLGKVKEVKDDENNSSCSPGHGTIPQRSAEAKTIELLARENAILRQRQYQSRIRPRASTAASNSLGNGYNVRESVPEESDYAIDELNESKRGTGRPISEYAPGAFRTQYPLENRNLENVKKAFWTSSLGFGGLLDIAQSRKHSFADVPTRQAFIRSLGEAHFLHEMQSSEVSQGESPKPARKRVKEETDNINGEAPGNPSDTVRDGFHQLQRTVPRLKIPSDSDSTITFKETDKASQDLDLRYHPPSRDFSFLDGLPPLDYLDEAIDPPFSGQTSADSGYGSTIIRTRPLRKRKSNQEIHHNGELVDGVKRNGSHGVAEFVSNREDASTLHNHVQEAGQIDTESILPPDSGYEIVIIRGEASKGSTRSSINQPETTQGLNGADDWISNAEETKTLYTDAPAIPEIRFESYITALADDIFKRLGVTSSNYGALGRLNPILPRLLKALALKLGHEASSQMHRDVMAFIHRYRRAITESFKGNYTWMNDQSRDSHANQEAIAKETHPTEDMNRWLVSVDEADYEERPGDLPEEYCAGVTDEEDGELTIPGLEEYKNFICNDPVYEWLLDRLRRELILSRAEQDAMEGIREEILRCIPKSSRVSRKECTSSQLQRIFSSDMAINRNTNTAADTAVVEKHQSYQQDLQVDHVDVSMADLEGTRHVVGWCSEAISYVGSPAAEYSIGRSQLPIAHASCSLEKAEISAGQFVTGLIGFKLGNREKPVHISRFGYLTKLQWISSKYVVLWDEEEKRGWLVNGASALLHLLRASLIHSSRKFKSAFLFDPSDLANAMDPHQSGSALDVLLNESNRDIKLYLDKSEVFDEETIEGATTSLVSRKQTRYYRMEDRIEHLYNTLEKLIDHQTDVERRDGLQITPRPRR
ncbi:hypothetical protein DL771_005978 [Monosporascus sp. 5C6A]|nr:hypothetical protein DL771_005978 [Monosporascus sp. 5C6A]